MRLRDVLFDRRFAQEIAGRVAEQKAAEKQAMFGASAIVATTYGYEEWERMVLDINPSGLTYTFEEPPGAMICDVTS